MRSHLLTLAGCIALSTPAAAQGQPSLLLDLNQAPITTYAFGQVKAAAQATTFTCFLTDDGGALTQLWRTDGTSAGTTLVTTIQAWTSSELEMVARNGLVFFTAPSPSNGLELWMSDGTSAGTVLLDCNPGAPSSSPRRLTVDLFTTSTRIWFSAADAAFGRELWVTDGTAVGIGTRRVWDLNPGNATAMTTTSEIWPTSSGVYFDATNGSTGREVFRYTSGAPTLIANIMPGSGSSNPANFVSSGSDLLFTATGPNGTELYHWNGSALTLIDVRAGTSSSSPSDLVLHAPTLLGIRYCFFAADGGNGIGRELWRYNLASGALNSYDLVPGSTGSDPNLRKLSNHVLATAGPIGGRRLFSVLASSTTATLLPTVTAAELWFFVAFTTPDVALVRIASPFVGGGTYHTDGTVAGTVLDTAYVAPPFARLPGGSRVLTQAAPTTGAPVAVVDDQPATTPPLELVPQIGATVGSNPGNFTDIGGGVVLFTATLASGRQLMRSDGTAAGTVPIGPAGSALSPLFLGKRFYVVQDGSAYDLWATDGTPAGTSLIANDTVSPWANAAQVHYSILGARLLVALGETLLATEGTAASTVLLHQSPPSVLMLGGFAAPVVFGNHVYFTAGDATHGVEIWRTDGTPAATQLFFDANPGSADGMFFDNRFCRLEAPGILLFVANDGVHGHELWRTDGTLAGTFLVKDIFPGPGGSLDQSTTYLVGDDPSHVLLAARTAAYGIEPCVTDGTAAGTFMLFDATAGAGDSHNLRFVGRVGGTLLLGAGPCLLETQGTPGSTSSLVNSATAISFDSGVPAFGGFVIPSTQGLWRSNGTLAGTQQLTTGYVDVAYGIPQGTKVLASMRTPANGGELWITDGTIGGTQLHADLLPGTGDGFPGGFQQAGGRIFFAADDGMHGRELFTMTSMAGAIPYGLPCAGSTGLPDVIATVPQLGGSFDVTLRNALPNTFGLFVLGLQSTELPLGGGCSLLVSTFAPYATFAVITSPLGFATVPTTIPNDPQLNGFLLHGQYAVLDPAGAFQSFLAFTNAITGIVGT